MTASQDHAPATGVKVGGRAYDFVDRRWEGYAGRWRYRVTERDVSTLARPLTFSVLFRRRLDAATFAGQCGMQGAQFAARQMDASGLRRDEDFRIEDVAQ